MTSRQYTGRTVRTDGRVPRRGPVRRGVLPSFGDIVLPIVSVAAIGLLILAGRQFFLNGMKTSPGMSSTRAYAEAPALIAEREQKEQREQERKEAEAVRTVAATQEAVTVSAEVTAAKDDTSFEAVSEILAQPQTQTAQKVTVTSTPAPAPAPKKTASAATTTKKTSSTTSKTTSTLPANKQWRVQVGAYGTKANAQKEADKIKKAGYKATVYSNPASKYVKVWVQGGADKASAEKVVNAMKKMGYKSSFSFPPAK